MNQLILALRRGKQRQHEVSELCTGVRSLHVGTKLRNAAQDGENFTASACKELCAAAKALHGLAQGVDVRSADGGGFRHLIAECVGILHRHTKRIQRVVQIVQAVGKVDVCRRRQVHDGGHQRFGLLHVQTKLRHHHFGLRGLIHCVFARLSNGLVILVEDAHCLVVIFAKRLHFSHYVVVLDVFLNTFFSKVDNLLTEGINVIAHVN